MGFLKRPLTLAIVGSVDIQNAIALAFAGAIVTLFCSCSEPDRGVSPIGPTEPQGVASPPLLSLAPGEIRSEPLLPRDNDQKTLFQRVPAAESGIEFTHKWTPRGNSERDLIATAFAGGAVALGDVDNNGLPDVFLTRPHGGARLYLNLGGFKFEDITNRSKLEGALADFWATGATFVDIQGDGHLDLYVCAYGMQNKLFINTGDGRFEERAGKYGLDFSGASVMMSFVDYDRDGDLDAHLLTNRLSGGDRPDGIEFKIVDGKVIAPEPYRDEVGAILKSDGSLHPFDAGQADRLYRNDGGKFTDAAESAGLLGHSHGLSATWWDYNSDGWSDLYVANDFFGPDHLFRNNQDGTFTDVIASAVPNTPWFSMGSDAGDLDGDGHLDFIAADMAATTHYKQKVNMGDMDAEGWFLDIPTPRQYMRNAAYINTGTPRFLEAAQMAGLSATDWTWAVKVADFDSDGRNDVFFSNGMTRDFFHADLRAKVREIHARTGENRWSDFPPLKELNRLFRNTGELKFDDVSRKWGIQNETVSFGAATGDLDGDGDLDLVVNNFEEAVDLYRNTSASGNLMKIALRGSDENSHGIGAEIRATTRKGEQVRVIQPVRGFFGCDPAEAVFGLGEETEVRSLSIRWPSGDEQTLDHLEAGHRYVIAEAENAPPIISSPSPKTLFTEHAVQRLPHHIENTFDDFAVQPLLPNKLSMPGPAMAWGDLTGNGKPDCFLGGSYGHAAQLWLQSGEGKLFRQRIPFFESDKLREDVDAALFDADGDGDLDIYVVSGGVEGTADDNEYQDRLYVSVDNGLGAASDDALPDMNFSGSCVAAGDFDDDGALDLFVGARVVPGEYPTSAPSRLLLNKSKPDGRIRFINAPAEVTSALANAGMVTDALWSDTDSDDDLDLLVTTEYGPVRIYHNDGGKLIEATEAAGLAERLGWWNCIAEADVDADGDPDYAVGNFGWNTKYHPTPDRPQLLYYGDFDGSGKSHVVEAHPDGDSIVPNRGRSCSSSAMPFIEKKFTDFHTFAVADLADIYTIPKLESSIRLEANELASGILLNNGPGADGQVTFEFKPLPWRAQIAPSFGLTFLDANGDGKIDLYVSQNFYGPQRETGIMAGGVGLLLTGSGDGSFRPVMPRQSGIVVAGDARGATVIDYESDGDDDLAVAINNGRVKLLINRGEKEVE